MIWKRRGLGKVGRARGLIRCTGPGWRSRESVLSGEGTQEGWEQGWGTQGASVSSRLFSVSVPVSGSGSCSLYLSGDWVVPLLGGLGHYDRVDFVCYIWLLSNFVLMTVAWNSLQAHALSPVFCLCDLITGLSFAFMDLTSIEIHRKTHVLI